MGTGGAQPDEVSAQAIDTGLEAAPGDCLQRPVIERDGRHPRTRLLAALGQCLLLPSPGGDKCLGVGIEGQAATHDLGPLPRLWLAIQRQVEAETVEQLRAQFALFGIHGADQDEARIVSMGNAVALDMVDAAGRRIEEQVDQMIGQQVDLIDVQHPAIGLAQQAGRELRTTFAQGRVQVEGTDDTLFTGAQRQGDEHTALQQRGQAAGQGRFGHAAWAFDQHAANRRIDRHQAQRQLQRVGTDHGGKGEVGVIGHGAIRLSKAAIVAAGGRMPPGSSAMVGGFAMLSRAPSTRETPMRLCIFCGSNAGTNPVYIEAATRLGQALAKAGIGLVYGGASVGLMGAVANAALEAGGEVIGVIPRSLWEKEVAHTGLDDLRIVDSMHQRKALMAELSDGFIALPGGVGTLEELFEVWTWAQLGHHQKPCALLNINGYYDRLAGFLDHMVDEAFVKAPHREMLIVEQDIDALLTAINGYEAPQVGKWIGRQET
ncbi:Cytokinin riboside 5'-monophosphate phosphoribohydrolase [Pseudomonas sp. Bi70]|nr:Cytokinin riboside 5'-monophosphate phosphoribohydrolase [Pseudomonas sp. Bi70]